MIVDLKPRVVELGKIKIGNKGDERVSQSGNKFRIPQKLDHFVITTLERDAKGDFKPDLALMDRLAETNKCARDTIRELPIALMADDIEDVFPTSYVYYSGNRCIARSDGETIEWLCHPQTFEPLPTPKVVENEKRFVQTAMIGEGNKRTRMFKPHGTLNCLIAAEGARWGGVYKLRTTSIISIEQIVSGLTHVQALTRGFLRNVPLRLVMRPMQVSPEGKTTTVYVCHVEIRGSDLTAVQQQVIQAAQVEIATDRQLTTLRREYVALLRAPGENEADDEQEDVNQEFSPETVEAVPVVQSAAPAPAPAAPAPAAHAEAPVQSAPETLDAQLRRRAAEAKSEADVTSLSKDVEKSKATLTANAYEAVAADYFAARERVTGKPAPSVTPTSSKRRSPPPPPPRAAPVAQLPAAPVTTAAPAISADEIPF